MTVLFVSPTEPVILRDLGVTTLIPETLGADISWSVGTFKYGIQRKEFPSDFLASLHDGRLTQQIAQAEQLDCFSIILEGRQVWTSEGLLVRERQHNRWNYTRSTHRRLIASIMARGVQIHTSDGLYDTIEVVKDLVAWSEKGEHNSLLRRVNPQKDSWGRRGNTAWQKHFIQGIPGIGPKQAAAIIETLGFPFEIKVTRESLMAVPGIGKTTADKILKVFE